jgi:hypothetical protein
MRRHHQEEECPEPASCADAAWSCRKQRKDTRKTSSLQGGGGKGYGYQGLTGLRYSTHTNATGIEAGTQTKTPVSGPVRCNFTIQGVSVSPYCHGSDTLQKRNKVIGRVIEPSTFIKGIDKYIPGVE